MSAARPLGVNQLRAYVAQLERRLRWLNQNPNPVSYDRTEIGALRWALPILRRELMKAEILAAVIRWSKELGL